MLLDDYMDENKKLMSIDIDVKKKDVRREVTSKEYLSEVNLDSVGHMTKEVLNTDFGYSLALGTVAGIGLGLYFNDIGYFVFCVVAGITTNAVLSVAEKAKIIEFK